MSFVRSFERANFVISFLPGPPGGGQLKRTGGLGLFFRKVYHLAHLRLDKLCSALEISDDGKRKIWTTFEHALREETHLMKDRHLDQILMCSLYIVCRVSQLQ